MLIKLVLLTAAVASAQQMAIGRLRQLFNKYPTFSDNLLIEVFHEKPTEEFLLNESQSLIVEMLGEFADWIEVSQIGEPTLEGRFIEVVSFKTAPPGAPAVLYDGAHHSRELITIKM